MAWSLGVQWSVVQSPLEPSNEPGTVFAKRDISLQNRHVFLSNSRVTLCDSLTRIAKGTMSKPYELQIIRLQLHLVNHMVKMGN